MVLCVRNAVHGCPLLVLSAFGLDYYSEVLDLQYLLNHMSNHPFLCKYKKLNEALIGLIEDYSLVTFTPLSIEVRVGSTACHFVLD